jgi:hypothetical protein
MKKYRLSKTKYVQGITCPKALWLSIYAPEKQAPPSPGTEYRFKVGIEVGLLAQERFLDGVEIKTPSYLAAKAVEETQTVVNSVPTAVFEAAFFFGNVLIRVDVLRRSADQNGGSSATWDLIEVKSTTTVKPEHLHDVAIQQYVLEGCGITVGGAYLMHINSACTYPDLSDLFFLEEVSSRYAEARALVPDTLQRFEGVLSQEAEPGIDIGPHCDDPYECAFKGYCWRHVPGVSIFNIPRLKANQKTELIARSILRIEDLPATYPLSDSQQKFVRLYRAGQPEIDAAGIRGQLTALDYPLYFLDFETDSPAVPRYPGTHPYEKVPFQYSCHYLEKFGSLGHCEYLHEELSDPRPSLVRSLIESIGADGSIMVYNAGFERGVLKALAVQQPQWQEALLGMAERLWDLLDIFRLYYFDSAFGGSNSIKNVLPVLVPDLSYEELEVQDGTEAQIAWNELLYLEDCEEKDQRLSALKQYCRLDSLAMVEIFKVLWTRYCSDLN